MYFAVYYYVSLYFSLFVSFICVLVVLCRSYLDLCFYSRWIWGETPGPPFFVCFFPSLFFLFSFWRPWQVAGASCDFNAEESKMDERRLEGMKGKMTRCIDLV